MATNYVADGATLDYTASSDLSSGDVVEIGNVIGVVKDDVDVSESTKAVLHIEGVFTLAKQAALAITQGAAVYWDDAAEEIDTTDTNTYAGIAYAAAAGADSTVKVKLNA